MLNKSSGDIRKNQKVGGSNRFSWTTGLSILAIASMVSACGSGGDEGTYAVDVAAYTPLQSESVTESVVPVLDTSSVSTLLNRIVETSRMTQLNDVTASVSNVSGLWGGDQFSENGYSTRYACDFGGTVDRDILSGPDFGSRSSDITYLLTFESCKQGNARFDGIVEVTQSISGSQASANTSSSYNFSNLTVWYSGSTVRINLGKAAYRNGTTPVSMSHATQYSGVSGWVDEGDVRSQSWNDSDYTRQGSSVFCCYENIQPEYNLSEHFDTTVKVADVGEESYSLLSTENLQYPSEVDPYAPVYGSHRYVNQPWGHLEIESSDYSRIVAAVGQPERGSVRLTYWNGKAGSSDNAAIVDSSWQAPQP